MLSTSLVTLPDGLYLALKHKPHVLQISCERPPFGLEIGLAFSWYLYKRLGSQFPSGVTNKAKAATNSPPHALCMVTLYFLLS